MVEELHVAMFGKGKVEHSVRFRMALAESMAADADRRVCAMDRAIKALTLAIITDSVFTLALAIMMSIHILST